MEPEAEWPVDAAPQGTVHRFTVLRGMMVAMVIETPDWYWGLVQAAAARIQIEALN